MLGCEAHGYLFSRVESVPFALSRSARTTMREMVSSDDRLAYLEEVLNDPSHPQWLAAYRFAAETGYGKGNDQIAIPPECRNLDDLEG